MPPKRAIATRRKQTAAKYRKDALKRLAEEYEGDFDPKGEPTVTPLLEAAEGGIPRIMEALRAHDNEDARSFVTLYDSLNQKDRKYLTLEEIAYASGIGSLRLAEVATSASILHGQIKAKLVIASSMHRVTQAIVKAATDEVPITAFSVLLNKNVVVGHTNGDTKAMELFGKMSGMVPIPKGNTFNFNRDADEKEPGRGDDPEPQYLDAGERLRLISDAVDPKRLPSPPSEHLPGMTHMQNETAVIISGDV